MCNIHGVVTSKHVGKAEEYMRDGFFAGQLRGTDSSGMAVVDTQKADVEMQKLPVCGSMFNTDRVAQRLMKQSMSANVISIGHLRAATAGAIKYSNAHPFYIADQGKELVGVHNGTLNGWHGKKDAKFYEVDSEWALNHIFSEGFDAFEDISGAFCFVWWESTDQHALQIALNDQRTMHVGFLEQGGMVYASEAGMLHWLCERNNLTLKNGEVLKLTAGNWYRFPVDDPEKYTKKELPKSKTTTYNGYYGQSTTTGSSYVYKTEVEKVEEVVVAALAKLKATVPSVTLKEAKQAQEEGVHTARGTFSPFSFDPELGELWGSFKTGDKEYMAVIRNSADLMFNEDTLMEVSCLGVLLDEKNKEPTLVCSKPIKEAA